MKYGIQHFMQSRMFCISGTFHVAISAKHRMAFQTQFWLRLYMSYSSSSPYDVITNITAGDTCETHTQSLCLVIQNRLLSKLWNRPAILPSLNVILSLLLKYKRYLLIIACRFTYPIFIIASPSICIHRHTAHPIWYVRYFPLHSTAVIGARYLSIVQRCWHGCYIYVQVI